VPTLAPTPEPVVVVATPEPVQVVRDVEFERALDEQVEPTPPSQRRGLFARLWPWGQREEPTRAPAQPAVVEPDLPIAEEEVHYIAAKEAAPTVAVKREDPGVRPIVDNVAASAKAPVEIEAAEAAPQEVEAAAAAEVESRGWWSQMWGSGVPTEPKEPQPAGLRRLEVADLHVPEPAPAAAPAVAPAREPTAAPVAEARPEAGLWGRMFGGSAAQPAAEEEEGAKVALRRVEVEELDVHAGVPARQAEVELEPEVEVPLTAPAARLAGVNLRRVAVEDLAVAASAPAARDEAMGATEPELPSAPAEDEAVQIAALRPVEPAAVADAAEQAAFDRAVAAANGGEVKAQVEVARRYARGNGVAADSIAAAAWYLEAAKQGDAGSQAQLGMMLDRGEGVGRDPQAAVDWYRRAAEQGHPLGQLGLGRKYDKGDGVARDATAAVDWYRRAAEQGNATAQVNLGVSYARGEGIARDNVEALRWLIVAARAGEPTAARYRDTVAANMSAAEIARATARAQP